MTEAEYHEKDLKQALKVLEQGGVILYPTDTIWGIGCDATNSLAVKKIFELKRRPGSKAMISLVESLEKLEEYVDKIPETAKEKYNSILSPLTIILDNAHSISPSLISEDGSAAFRIPRLNYTAELCKRFGKPVVSTSANFAGEPSALSFDEISSEIKAGVDYICEFGRDNKNASPSKIIKINSVGEIAIIR